MASSESVAVTSVDANEIDDNVSSRLSSSSTTSMTVLLPPEEVPSDYINCVKTLVLQAIHCAIERNDLPPFSWPEITLRKILRNSTSRPYTHSMPTCVRAYHNYMKQLAAKSNGSADSMIASGPQTQMTDFNSSSPSQWARCIHKYLKEIINGTIPSGLLMSESQSALEAAKDVKLVIHVEESSETGCVDGMIAFAFYKCSTPTSENSFSRSSKTAVDRGIYSRQTTGVESHKVRPLGYMKSCYKLKYGTPRQPHLAPSSRATLSLLPHVNDDFLEDLVVNTYCWLVFVFHANGDHRPLGKIQPPRLGGLRVGVLSTRSPHRPNPIGLSLVRLESIKERTLEFSAIDVIENTPILNVLPAHSTSSPLGAIQFPDWVREERARQLSVVWTDRAIRDLSSLFSLFHSFESTKAAKAAITQSVEFDPRPAYIRRAANSESLFGFRMDNINAVFRVEGTQAIIEALEPIQDFSEDLQESTRLWVSKKKKPDK